MRKSYHRPGNKTNHEKQTKHGFSSIKNRHPLYSMWLNIKNRCYSKHPQSSNKSYLKNNIKVCDEWKNNALTFINWALSNGWIKGLTIDRINPKKDYTPENCQFITLSENIKKIHTDTPGFQTGSNNHHSKLTEDDVRNIRVLIADGKRNFEIAKEFNVLPGCISMIRCKVIWKHLV